MKQISLLFTTLLLCFLVLEPLGESSAQTVTARRLAISPAQLGTYTPGTYPISGGLRVVGVGSKVYYTADTTGTITGFSWTVTSAPTGSAASFNSASIQSPIFTPDKVGMYVLTVTGTGAGTPSVDTIYAELYFGVTNQTDCAPCHSGALKKWDTWKTTPHAQIFQLGITGELEVAPNTNGQMVGTYSASCVKCHTTGWDPSLSNGNFGNAAHQTGYDTMMFKNATPVGSSFQILQGDQTAWNLLNTSAYSSVRAMSSIECEQCHGPATGHVNAYGNPAFIAVSNDAGVCLQCHNAPTHHMVGAYYLASNHATMPLAGSHATSTSCFPCHSGSAFIKYAYNQTTPGFSSADASKPITCQACHDPHVSTNFGLRPVTITLKNGYSVNSGGNGQICMTCHQDRNNVNTTVTNTAPYYGYKDRFGPHHGPQSDMFFGQNAYQYGNDGLTGLMTHGATTDACVTCHMANIGTSAQPSHQWSMIDTTGGTAKDFVVACRSCHGSNINSFSDIQANSDLDGNGKIEGFQTEVQGMLGELKSLLPLDSKGSGEPCNMIYDSSLVKNKPNVVRGIYTYYFVMNDGSFGVHNPKYTTAILQSAIIALGGVTPVELTSLSAQNVNGAVQISWETATEINNKGFEIQRKQGSSWKSVGFKEGSGTSTQISKYSFVDNTTSSLTGNVSYRINQIDLNGTSHLSKEVSVALNAGPSSYELSQNYPNPFNPSTIIKFSLPFESNVKLVIYSITGSVIETLVNSVQSSGYHEVVLNTNTSKLQMASGVYFYSIEATSLDGSKTFRNTKKMVLMK